MAIRKIVKTGDPILRTVCKPVEKFDERLHTLLDDMKDTLKKAEGVGLAAPQVGYCRRIFIMDLGGNDVIEAINPQIIKTSGKQRPLEGCLSCPNQWGYVKRPKKCHLRAQDRNGKWYEMILTDLGAQCACHENDHLDGKLFIDVVDEFVDPDKE
ncbi:MAG: peptide deformylase [Ruminococcus sp.]|nr:peptide deformylase [Ruminococcus sp.]